MVNWQSQSKNTPQIPEDGHIYCILLIRIANHNTRPPPRVRKTDTFIVFPLSVLHSITCPKTCHLAACDSILWTSISVFYVKTARYVVTVLLIFAKYISLYLHIFTCTYRGTNTQVPIYNQHTRGMATTRHRSLVERGGRKALLESLHTQKKNVRKKPIFTNLKKRFEHIELPAKLLDSLLRSNKSNINNTQIQQRLLYQCVTRRQ